MQTDERGLPKRDRPDGPISGLFHDYDRRLRAAHTHECFEGYSVGPRTILEGYDRALHPWMRGWRFGEIGDTLRGLLWGGR